MSQTVEGDNATRPGSGTAAPGDERASIWSILSHPRIYGFLQRISGADHARRVFAEEIVRCGPDERVLDIGCGTADLIEHLPTTISYLGVESRARYVDHARERFGDRGTFVLGIAEEFSAIEAGPRDLVLAGAVMHHLDDDAVHDLLAMAHSVLVPGGRFVAADPVILTPQHPVARAVARLDRGRHVRTVAATEALVAHHFPEASITVRSGLQRFPYDHVVVDARR